MACIAEEVDVSAIGEGLDCAFGDGVAADPVDGSNGHGVGMGMSGMRRSRMPRVVVLLVRGFVE